MPLIRIWRGQVVSTFANLKNLTQSIVKIITLKRFLFIFGDLANQSFLYYFVIFFNILHHSLKLPADYTTGQTY